MHNIFSLNNFHEILLFTNTYKYLPIQDASSLLTFSKDVGSLSCVKITAENITTHPINISTYAIKNIDTVYNVKVNI